MTSFLEVIAADDRNERLASRKYVVLATTRFDERFHNFFRVASSRDDVTARWEYAIDDIRAVAASAADELGYAPSDSEQRSLTKALLARAMEAPGFEPWPGERKASLQVESRRVKMCPFHKDVVDISLADGNPSAGFSAMAQHWGGSRHCEGDGYEGDKCNFKPTMTTQSYWDERKEKAEQRRQEREQQAELEAQQPVEEEVVDEVPAEDAVEPAGEDNVVEVDFGGSEVSPEADGAEAPDAVEAAPMSMAASTKTADGGPSPKMDKRKWTPQTVGQPELEGEDSRNPTKRKDVVEPIKPENGTRFNPSKPSEIGENKTERQDVSEATNPSDQGASTQTWTEGPKTAVSAVNDAYHENSLVELIKNDFDGFLPAHEVQQAVLAHRSK